MSNAAAIGVGAITTLLFGAVGAALFSAGWVRVGGALCLLAAYRGLYVVRDVLRAGAAPADDEGEGEDAR